MYTIASNTVTRAVSLFCAVSLVVLVGCDYTGNPDADSDSEDYEVTNDLGERVEDTTTTDGKALGKEADLAFNLSARILPPTIQKPEGELTARATALTFDGVHSNGNNIYIGYLLWQEPFGGGIDIVDARNPTNLSEAVSIKSDNTDVQALASPLMRKNKIYVAEAVQDTSKTPARVSIIHLEDGNSGTEIDQVQTQPLSGWVAKTAVVEPALAEPADENADYLEDFYVTDDSNTVYRYKKHDLSAYELKWSTPEPAEFSGIASTYESVFALTIDGDVYHTKEWAQDEPDPSMDLTTTIDPISETPEHGISGGIGNVGIERLGIGRLTSADPDSRFERDNISNLQGTRLFAALGYGGFAVLDGSGQVIHRFDPSEADHYNELTDGEYPYYTSVGFHGNVPAANGDDYLYAARRNGAVDVYRIPNGGISNMEFTRTLYIRQAFDLGESDGAEPSINHVAGVDGSNEVYLAGGKEGTLILRLGPANPKPIAQAAFCATNDASADDLTVTPEEDTPVTEFDWESEKELSTVVVKAGNEMYNYSGGTAGTVISEAGERVRSWWQRPSSPCPYGEDLIDEKGRGFWR